MIRVGRCVYENGQRKDPSYEGFRTILVLTKSSPYASLSPYCLEDEHGRNMENIWQFSKAYETVPKTVCKYSRYDNRIIWSWEAERHATKLEDGSYDLNEKYFIWRNAGMLAKDAIRYPVGFKDRHKCLFSLKEEDGKILPKALNYVEGRKEIYLPVYTKLVKKEKQFFELKERLKKGENLLIVEVDGPHSESLPHYQEKYNVDKDFIIGNTMLATKENLSIMLEDTLHPFGHGYCLAVALSI
jgi:hypothetical protein